MPAPRSDTCWAAGLVVLLGAWDDLLVPRLPERAYVPVDAAATAALLAAARARAWGAHPGRHRGVEEDAFRGVLHPALHPRRAGCSPGGTRSPRRRSRSGSGTSRPPCRGSPPTASEPTGRGGPARSPRPASPPPALLHLAANDLGALAAVAAGRALRR